MAEKPELIEIAPARDSDEFLTAWANAIREPNDPILQGRGAGSDLRLYDEVRLDAQVSSTLQQRRDAVIAIPFEVIPGDERPASEEAADRLREELEALDFDTRCRRMSWGVFYGYAVAEAMWDTRGGRVTIDGLRVRRARRFGFDIDGRLMLRRSHNRDEQPMPERKFWVMSTGADTDDEPYGLGLAHFLYWPAYFKRHGLKAWMIALDKFASPTAVGKFPPGTSPEDQQKLLAALEAIRQDSAFVIPEGMTAEYLQTAKSAGMDYHAFHKFLDSMIAKIVLSQTMTTDDGASLSQSEVHLEVRDEVAAADAALLCGSFNEGPGQWWTEWNFGDRAAPPVVRRVKEEPEDADAAAARDEKLSRIGWRPSKERVDRVYGEGYEPGGATGQDAGPQDGDAPELADPEPDAIAAFVDELVAGGAAPAAAADILAPIVGEIEASESLEALRARLDGFALSDGALEPFRELLAQAMFATRLGGEVGAELRDGLVSEEA